MSTEILIIRIQPTLKEQAEKLAMKNGISLSALTRYSLRFALEPKNEEAVMGNFMKRHWADLEQQIIAGKKALERERHKNGKDHE
jgi:predicted aspartyl protease